MAGRIIGVGVTGIVGIIILIPGILLLHIVSCVCSGICGRIGTPDPCRGKV